MGDITLADIMKKLESLTTEMSTMQADMAAMKDKSASSSSGGGGDRAGGPRDLDRPPQF
jgi:hypothetical protein